MTGGVIIWERGHTKDYLAHTTCGQGGSAVVPCIPLPGPDVNHVECECLRAPSIIRARMCVVFFD